MSWSERCNEHYMVVDVVLTRGCEQMVFTDETFDIDMVQKILCECEK